MPWNAVRQPGVTHLIRYGIIPQVTIRSSTFYMTHALLAFRDPRRVMQMYTMAAPSSNTMLSWTGSNTNAASAPAP